MMEDLKQFKSFVWVIYPLMVAAIIFLSIGQLQAGGANKLTLLMQKHDQAAQEEQKLSLLQQKLASLRAVDLAKENNDLVWTLTVMPAAKQVWLMLAELDSAASQSGSTIKSYSGEVGNVNEASAAAARQDLPVSLNVEFAVPSFDQLRTIIGVLEKSLPLINVTSVAFDGQTARISVTGAWSAWGNASSEAMSPLPEYQGKFNDLQSKLQGFAVLPVQAGVAATQSGAVNPF